MKNVTNFCKTVETGVDPPLRTFFPKSKRLFFGCLISRFGISEEIARVGIQIFVHVTINFFETLTSGRPYPKATS